MRYTEIVVLAIGNLAAAQLTTRFPDTIASAIESSTLATGTEVPDAIGGIGTPNGFNFLGCFSSKNGFPGFTQAYSSIDNNANLCAKTYLGANFFGLYDNKCYCSSELNLITSPSISADQYDIACPGNANISCRGLAAGSRVIQQQVDISVLLSIYIAVGVSPGETDTAIKTDFGTKT